MKKFLAVLLMLTSFSVLTQAQNDYALVKTRVVAELLKHKADDNLVNQLIKKQNEDGSWPGINYDDVSNTGFEHTRHLSNMVQMSTAYAQKNSQFYRSRIVKEGITKALNFWCNHDFICENWWYNQIGTPTALVNVLLLMGDDINAALIKRTLPIIARGSLDASGARPGGDRIKIGGIEAKRFLVAGNETDFENVMKAIGNEIKFNTGDRGIQCDYSFHHRVFRVNNTTSYGLSYASIFAEWAAYVAGTKYAFKKDKLKLLINYYLDGICKQMVYGVSTDPGVQNRDISRKEAYHPSSTTIPERLLIASDYRKNELRQLIQLRQGTVQPKNSFSKFFWQTEHFVFQRPEFYTSVRMFSIRNMNMEWPYNSEGLKNHHKADGANFLSKTGDEYNQIWPVYDWQKIPGTTVGYQPELPSEKEIQKRGLTRFVGAVTDDKYGAVGFDFISPHDYTTARKGWFFFDDEYVCLGASIKCDAPYSVITTVDQCLLKSKVIAEYNNMQSPLDSGNHELTNVRWIYHNGTGYIFPSKQTVNVSNKTQTGSWYSINQQWNSPKEPVSKKVFCLWINHGKRPQGRPGGLVNKPMPEIDAKYEYIVIPNTELDKMDNDRGIKILANNRDLQAVENTKIGIVQVVFYKAGEVNFSEKQKLTCDSQGTVMVKYREGKIFELTVADPSRQLSILHLNISNQVEANNNDTISTEYDSIKNITHLSIQLPTGDYAGCSTTFSVD